MKFSCARKARRADLRPIKAEAILPRLVGSSSEMSIELSSIGAAADGQFE